MGPTIRTFLLALVAIAIWLLDDYTGTPHRVAGPSTPVAEFSASRANDTLARVLGPEKPHPVSTSENAAVRARIVQEFLALGIPVHAYQAFTCNPGRRFGFIICASVTDLIADVVPGSGKAIVMMAHYDSVPAGPGASDDESGVATVLETARALKARGGKSIHPVIALITDGEEADLLGANAFLQNTTLRDRVGAVVNVEARGTKGPSLLFQTSAGDGKLIDLYAAHVPHLAASSLYAEIYKYLPNDTDLTLFIREGFPSFNFAFADNVRYYHSPFDLRRNLSLATLQMHGENLLGVVSGLEQTDFADLKGGNDIYLSILGVALPRVSESWALPLSIVVFLLLAIAAWLAKGEGGNGRLAWKAALMPLALLAGCAALGFVTAFIASTLSGHPDPTYAHPIFMRVALAYGVWAMAMLVSRMPTANGATASAWLWMAGFGVATAIFLPGISPYFVFPGIVAAILLLLTARAPGGWNGMWGQIAIFVSSLGALVIWLALVGSGETLMGLRLHPLFTIPAAFGLMTIVPLLSARPMERTAWLVGTSVCFAGGLILAIVAGLEPAYSAASPQRIDLIYFENEKGSANWIATTSWKGIGTEPIPASLKNAGHFAINTDAFPGLDMGSAYTSPAGKPLYPLPTATVTDRKQVGANHAATLHLQGSNDTDAMILHIPKTAKLADIMVNDQHVAVPKDWIGDARIYCLSRDCRNETIILTYAGSLSGIEFAEGRYDFPASGDFLKAARPANAMASQSGDEIMLANDLKAQ